MPVVLMPTMPIIPVLIHSLSPPMSTFSLPLPLLLFFPLLILLKTSIKLHALDHSFNKKFRGTLLVSFGENVLNFILDFFTVLVVVRHWGCVMRDQENMVTD